MNNKCGHSHYTLTKEKGKEYMRKLRAPITEEGVRKGGRERGRKGGMMEGRREGRRKKRELDGREGAKEVGGRRETYTRRE